MSRWRSGGRHWRVERARYPEQLRALPAGRYVFADDFLAALTYLRRRNAAAAERIMHAVNTALQRLDELPIDGPASPLSPTWTSSIITHEVRMARSRMTRKPTTPGEILREEYLVPLDLLPNHARILAQRAGQLVFLRLLRASPAAQLRPRPLARIIANCRAAKPTMTSRCVEID
jgi:hypothetical protein